MSKRHENNRYLEIICVTKIISFSQIEFEKISADVHMTGLQLVLTNSDMCY